jgi:hypothetical protein
MGQSHRRFWTCCTESVLSGAGLLRLHFRDVSSSYRIGKSREPHCILHCLSVRIESACEQYMELSAVKDRLREIESQLATQPYILFHTFEREGQSIHVAVTDRLRKKARKEGVWQSREMLATLKNASYSFDERNARSVSGRDGIFLLDRSFRPVNEMMRKLFDRFLDKPNSGVAEIAASLDFPLTELLPVRLVSHHMRLLGVLARKADGDWLVLVDCDRE